MALFKDLFNSSRSLKEPGGGNEVISREPDKSSGPETVPIKMNLEERMAFRREILFDTVCEVLNQYRIAPHTYRCKVMRTDKRGHCFAVMLDMSEAFLASPEGQHKQLAAIAADLAKQSEADNHIVIAGVYWRLDETLADQASTFGRSAEGAALGNNDMAHNQSHDQPHSQSHSQSHSQATQSAEPQHSTQEEVTQFDGLWQSGAAEQSITLDYLLQPPAGPANQQRPH